MAKYINAAEAAEKVATAYKIPMGDLVDVFAGIPVADVAPVIHAHWVQTSKRVIYCPNCGAPLPLLSSTRCEYCGSSVLPDASVSADAVRIQLLAIEVARMRFADAQAKLLRDISNRPRRNTFE